MFNDLAYDFGGFAGNADGASQDLGLLDTNFTVDTSFNPINDPAPAQTPDTVSPKDLLMDHSAPPSTAFTNLSTPGFSPMDSDAYSADTSPLFATAEDLDPMESQNWSSLFPEENINAASNFSPATKMEDLQLFATPAPMSRNQSSPGQSPYSGRASAQGRHSSVSGVNARKRDKPLPPITIEDPSDIVAVKRARNTAAARKSRQKKMESMDKLELENSELRAEVAKWKALALAMKGGQT